MVKKINGRWCVVHGHVQKKSSERDKPIGSIIKCFDGTDLGKRKAEMMHRAIVISQQQKA